VDYGIKMDNQAKKPIIFDTGPVISLTTNNLLWVLDSLKKQYKGNFYITPTVKRELVDTPIQSKKFKFEALQVMHCINKNVLGITNSERLRNTALKLAELANQCFMAKGSWLQIVHYGEMEALAAAIMLDASALVIDERTTRLLIENPGRLEGILANRLYTKISINRKNLHEFAQMAKGIRLLRSAELLVVAYEIGSLDRYILNIPKPRKQLLESILWGVKLHGCAISREEIDAVVGEELGKADSR